MSEFAMGQKQDIDPSTVEYSIEEAPIKTSGETIDTELLAEQALAARDCLVPVDYYKVPGTCRDERPRVGLLSGEDRVEARPAIDGGPNIYALAVAELIDYFGQENQQTGKARLERVTHQLEVAGFKSGGHLDCRANAGFKSWLRLIVDNPEIIKAEARRQRGDAYNDDAMNAVIAHARLAAASGRYEDWSEDILAEVLADKAGEALEKLADVVHEAVTRIRNSIPNTTLDKNALYDRSVVGRGSFETDDGYADAIEHALTSGPDASRKKLVAEHAREAILAAVDLAVPNPLLFQINLAATVGL